MHANIFHVIFVGHNVLLSRKPRQSFFVNVNFKRINGGYQNIDSQIKFQSVDQVRLAYVPLDYAVLSPIDILNLSGQKNPLTLRHRLRFYNVSTRFSLGFSVVVCFELVVVEG